MVARAVHVRARSMFDCCELQWDMCTWWNECRMEADESEYKEGSGRDGGVICPSQVEDGSTVILLYCHLKG